MASAPPVHGETTAIAAAVVTLVIFVLSSFGVTLTGDVAAALTTVVSVTLGALEGRRRANGGTA